MNATGFWEPNAGLVDEDGHWRPLYSSGYNGIDDNEWYDRKIETLKRELGYDCRDVATQYREKVNNAIECVFGKKWYMVNNGECAPRVIEMTKKDKENFDEFKKRRSEYLLELMHRSDSMFMEAFKRDDEDERPIEVGLIDDDHIKETCKEFCDFFSGNVGFMTHILDRMARLGYDPWCTCTDCGAQFQNTDYESFSAMLDGNSYTGDGGIGVIMKRILCQDCIEVTRCPCCSEYDLPNSNDDEHYKKDLEMYDLFARVMLDWIGICWGCSNGFYSECAEIWSEKVHQWVPNKLGEEYEKIKEEAEKSFGEGGGAYDIMVRATDGRAMVNRIRDLFESKARAYRFFDSSMCLDDEDYARRLIEEVPEQYTLKGLEEI